MKVTSHLKPGAIVQLGPNCGAFAYCFMVVTEPKSFGATGYVQGLGQGDEPGGQYPYRAPWEDMEPTGGLPTWIVDSEGTMQDASAGDMLPTQQLDEIDARIAAMSPGQKAERVSELRTRALASMAGIQMSDHTVDVIEATEMVAIFDDCDARLALRKVLGMLKSGAAEITWEVRDGC